MKKIKRQTYNINDFLIGKTDNDATYKIVQPASKVKSYLLNRNLHKSIGLIKDINFDWYVDLTGTKFYISEKGSKMIINNLESLCPLKQFVSENQDKSVILDDIGNELSLYQLITLELNINELMYAINRNNDTYKDFNE